MGTEFQISLAKIADGGEKLGVDLYGKQYSFGGPTERIKRLRELQKRVYVLHQCGLIKKRKV